MPDTPFPERHERAVYDEPVEVREDENGKPVISGYAAVYDSRSNDLGGFVEIIRRGAFDDALRAKPDVTAKVQHQGGVQVLGRTKNNTLKLWTDVRGLRYEISPPDTQAGRDIVTLIRRGDIDKSSFAFSVADPKVDQKWDFDQTPPVRELLRVNLHDVSPVSGPAYEGTSVGLRSQALASLEEARQAAAVDAGAADVDALANALALDLLDAELTSL